MNDIHFWQIIEAAWTAHPELNAARRLALRTNDPYLLESLSYELTDIIGENLRQVLQTLDKPALTSFLLTMEEKLYHLDRQELQRYTDGADDDFLYCRCFIVGMGEAYYNGIDSNPALATMDLEADSIGFIGYEVYLEKFNEPFTRNTIHCIETGSNKKGW
ncbi:DUF4240 domain-containing protein [Chitinophaga qingshengii]|uniref:DUF4240 domain-containing protein n=1 Tax=Chitinophaga qingshengii TaxID=1569794 RepID=A0ABR7TNV6_9BACT|nr:DUF4240 domain-containing protein [Chitinophaga qingshengii]MBC9931683.1 DUF4240 domain-containing protein [Chitinophaga qingshengii]